MSIFWTGMNNFFLEIFADTPYTIISEFSLIAIYIFNIYQIHIYLGYI